MSGAEAIVVIGVISSIISIIDEIKQVCDAATSVQGLPEAFCSVANRLPIIRTILSSAKQYIDEGNMNENSFKGVKHVVEACEKKVEGLDKLFRNVVPLDGTSDLKRYYNAVKTYGKGEEVEKLMKGILEDVQLLACERGMKTSMQSQQDQIAQAITELNKTVQANAIPGCPLRDDAQACLTAIFQTDPKDDREKLVHLKGSRVDGTCQWIKTNPLYISWLSSHSQLLWLSGGPGKGKTMLSIFLAEELEEIAKQSQDSLLLQYFCDNKDEKRNTAVSVLRGLVFQLLRLRPSLFDHILPTFKVQKDSLFSSSSFESLWRVFETMLHDPVLGTTYCVLDGLDECDEASLEVLLGKFNALLSSNLKCPPPLHFNLIAISRDLPDIIPEMLSNFPRIRLDPDAEMEVNNDISHFIEAKVNDLSTHRQYPELLQKHVKEVFQKRAQGTFLWVGIVAKSLKRYKVTEVEKALDLFPPGLEAIYARLLLQIDIDRREIAAKILRWVVMAVRPLTLSELSAATDIIITQSTIFDCNEVMRDRVSSCGYFLMIKEDQVSLIHQSAKDYLLRKACDTDPVLEFFRVKEEMSNLEIARTCLKYLQNGALAKGYVILPENTSRLKEFPLLSYATLNWPEHAKYLSRSEDLFKLSQPFYHEKSEIRMSWLKTYWSTKDIFGPPKSFTLLHLSSYFGILPLAENILLKKGLLNKVKRSIFLNKRDGRGSMALHYAAVNGHEDVVWLLLRTGVDVKAVDLHEDTALTLAACGGHKAVVQLLLEKGADVEAKDNRGRTPLYVATMVGNEAIVKLLLEKGADVEAKVDRGRTPLHVATMNGNEAIIKLLLEKGADVEAKDGNGRTPLQLATMRRNEAVVQLLLEKGADLEAKDNNERTALHWASIHGNEAAVKLLLEKGADLEAKNNDGYPVLYVSARRKEDPVMMLLQEKGANLKVKNDYGRIPLDLLPPARDEAIRLALNPVNQNS